MATDDKAADWSGFWGASNYRLSFSRGAAHTVGEVRGAFFRPSEYSTLWAPISATDAGATAAAGATNGGGGAGGGLAGWRPATA